MAREVKLPAFLLMRDNMDFWFDFPNFTSGSDGVSSLLTGTGAAAAVADSLTGLLVMGTGVVANNSVIVRSTNALYQIANNRPIIAEARLQYAEAAVNQANVAFGVTDTPTATWLGDNAGGPKTTGTQVMIYKTAGASNWRAQARNGTAFSDSGSGTTAGGTNYTILRVEVKDMSLTQATCYYSVDGVPLRDALTGLVINHQINLSGALLMDVACMLKCNSTTAEALNLDYMGASQTRF